MTKLAVTYPDPERVVRDYLATVMGGEATVRVGVPGDWTPQSGSHLQVATDGMFMANHPIVGEATVRIVAWAASPTEAKRLAQLAQGHLLAHPGDEVIARTRPLVGLLPSRDFQTQAETASVTVRVSLRSAPIEP